jgi:hypothetical protein
MPDMAVPTARPLKAISEIGVSSELAHRQADPALGIAEVDQQGLGAQLLHVLCHRHNAEAAVDDGVFVLVLISETLKLWEVFFEQKLDGVDSPSADRPPS